MSPNGARGAGRRYARRAETSPRIEEMTGTSDCATRGIRRAAGDGDGGDAATRDFFDFCAPVDKYHHRIKSVALPAVDLAFHKTLF